MKHAIAHAPDRKLATIMFTDIVGYSSQTQENEALALELLEEHRRLLRPIFHRHGGTEIKTIGDAFLVEFASALAAALCGIEMQKTLCERNAFEPPERRLQIRIGMHLGDVEHRDNDVYGDGVNIASRIETLAAPGGVYISEDVARQIQNKIGQPILRLGRSELKNIQLPVEIHRIVLPWERTRPVLSQRLSFSLKRKNVSRGVTLGLVFFMWVGVTWWREDPSLPPPVAAEAARPEPIPSNVDQVHSRLRAFLDGNIPAADLRIIYYDLHPIFGIHAGPWIAAKGTGEIQQDVEEGNRPQDLSMDEIEDLVRLLIDIEAWEQRVPWFELFADETRAHLLVRVGGASSEIWEWQHDLDSNQRIVKVLDKMKKFAGRKEDPGQEGEQAQAEMKEVRGKIPAKSHPSKKVRPPLKAGTDANARGQADFTALMWAVSEGHADTVQALLDAGTDVNDKNKDGRTALMEAASRGHLKPVQVLLDAGAKVDDRNKRGRTALMEAASQGHPATVEVLLARGADVDAKEKSAAAMLQAVKKGFRFLAGRGSRSNDNSNRTALMMAAWRGYPATVRVLLKAGADVGAKAKEGETAVMLAAREGHAEIVQALIKAGADVNVKTKRDETALMMAASRGHTATVRVLLGAGAKVNTKDKTGQTALLHAIGNGHTDIIRLLRKAGG